MLFKIKHFSVNWIDGMKISKDHFIDTNNYITDLVRDSTSTHTTTYNYGLLPSNSSENSFEISITKENQSFFSIILKRCHAITMGGFKINYDSQNGIPLSITKEIQENANAIDTFYIILIANPYNRTPIGTPSVEENPPRHPYSDITYSIEILPNTEINVKDLSAFHLLLGKIIYKDGQTCIQENYIPPCTSINSHENLIEHYISIKKSMTHLQNTSLSIIKKVQDKNKYSTLSKNITILCQNILSFISTTSYSYSNELFENEPIKVVGYVASLALNQYHSIKCFAENEQEEFFKYIFEWTDLTPKEFEDILFSSSTIPYDHNEINTSMAMAIYYLNITEKIWGKMNTLEFIGQRRENMVVTHELIQIKEEQPKRRWSILD